MRSYSAILEEETEGGKVGGRDGAEVKVEGRTQKEREARVVALSAAAESSNFEGGEANAPSDS